MFVSIDFLNGNKENFYCNRFFLKNGLMFVLPFNGIWKKFQLEDIAFYYCKKN